MSGGGSRSANGERFRGGGLYRCPKRRRVEGATGSQLARLQLDRLVRSGIGPITSWPDAVLIKLSPGRHILAETVAGWGHHPPAKARWFHQFPHSPLPSHLSSAARIPPRATRNDGNTHRAARAMGKATCNVGNDDDGKLHAENHRKLKCVRRVRCCENGLRPKTGRWPPGPATGASSSSGSRPRTHPASSHVTVRRADSNKTLISRAHAARPAHTISPGRLRPSARPPARPPDSPRTQPSPAHAHP